MTMQQRKIEKELKEMGAVFVRFVDIRNLSGKENKNFPTAILFGINLSIEYLQTVIKTPDYVQEMIRNNRDFSKDEYHLTELKTGELADKTSQRLIESGYKAYSHSDENQIETGFFDGIYEGTPLPHKTIARLAGIGWIGKNNLLVTQEFGCALCLGVVLTDAPLETTSPKLMQSKCDNCNICVKVCEPKTLKGQTWNVGIHRDDMLDVYKCTTCLKCMIFCTWTQNYINKI